MSVPLLTPHRSAVADQVERESILVRVRAADGVEGEAECPALLSGGYVTETVQQAWNALAGAIAAAELSGTTQSSHGTPAASASMADALLDCRLRRSGTPLSRHLGEVVSAATSPSVPWTAVLADPDGDPGALRDAADRAIADGATMLKAKVDGPSRLRATVAALREAIGDRSGPIGVAVDANGTLREADLADVDDLALEYLEQPLPAGTPWPELAEAAARCRTPLALDESLVSLDSLADALRSRALGCANIKPARIGGVMAAARAVALCRAAGLPCFVGGMFELGLGRAAALAVAALEGCTHPTDLGPSRRYFAEDLTEPLDTEPRGAVVVPHGPGSGRNLIEERVADHLADRVVVGAPW